MSELDIHVMLPNHLLGLMKKYPILNQFWNIRYDNHPHKLTIIRNRSRCECRYGTTSTDIIDANYLKIADICNRNSSTGLLTIVESIEEFIRICCQQFDTLQDQIVSVIDEVIHYLHSDKNVCRICFDESSTDDFRTVRRRFLGVGRGKYEHDIEDQVPANKNALLSSVLVTFAKMMSTSFMTNIKNCIPFEAFLKTMSVEIIDVSFSDLPRYLQVMFACNEKIKEFL